MREVALKIKIDERADMATMKNEQDEFARQTTCLRKIVNAKELSEKDRNQNSLLSTSTLVDQSPTSSSPKASPINFDKLQCIKFSGSPCDFSILKRDFKTMVAPTRELTATGMYLKQAVPEKYEHLIANVDLSNWVQMMTILQGKFGRPFLIVEGVVSDIEKIKPITGEKADKLFVDFVETLEKIEQDLECQNLLSEVSNATVIGKIQSKLPLEIGK